MNLFGIQFNNGWLLDNQGGTTNNEEKAWVTDDKQHAERRSDYLKGGNTEVKGVVKLTGSENEL